MSDFKILTCTYCLEVFQHLCSDCSLRCNSSLCFSVENQLLRFAAYLVVCHLSWHCFSLSDTGQVQKDSQSLILSTVLVDITTLAIVANIAISTTSLRPAHFFSSVRRFRSLMIHAFLRRKRNKGANTDSACIFIIRYRLW